MNNYKHPNGHVFYRKMGHERPMVSHGEGIYLFDVAGKRYIDGSGGPFVINVGHGRTEIVAAMADQAQKAAYAHAIMFTSEVVEKVSAELSSIVPFSHARFFYLSSGSEVVEGAIKLARQIQMARGQKNRHIIISRTHSYHGMTLGALSVSGRPGLRQPYLKMMHSMVHIGPAYPYRDARTGEEMAAELEAAILEAGPQNVAAFLAEPISGASLGAAVPPDDYWPSVRAICDRYGVLLVADEVLAGMGRTGRWWSINHWDVKPDIMVASKGTAGGYAPHGFIACEHADVELIRTQLGDFNHGGTFSHHPVAAAAALETLRIMKREKLVDRSAEMGSYLGLQLQKAFGDHPHIGDVRGRGMFWGLEFVADRKSKEAFSAERHLSWKIWEQAFARGLIVYYSSGCVDGKQGDLIMVGPPYIATRTQIDDLVGILKTAIKAEIGI